MKNKLGIRVWPVMVACLLWQLNSYAQLSKEAIDKLGLDERRQHVFDVYGINYVYQNESWDERLWPVKGEDGEVAKEFFKQFILIAQSTSLKKKVFLGGIVRGHIAIIKNPKSITLSDGEVLIMPRDVGYRNLVVSSKLAENEVKRLGSNYYKDYGTDEGNEVLDRATSLVEFMPELFSRVQEKFPNVTITARAFAGKDGLVEENNIRYGRARKLLLGILNLGVHLGQNSDVEKINIVINSKEIDPKNPRGSLLYDKGSDYYSERIIVEKNTNQYVFRKKLKESNHKHDELVGSGKTDDETKKKIQYLKREMTRLEKLIKLAIKKRDRDIESYLNRDF